MKKLKLKDVVARILKAHGDSLSLEKFEYVNSTTKSIFICKKHGEFSSTPKEVMKGHGCPICGLQKNRYRITQEEAEKRIINVHGDKYDLSKFIYTKAKDKSIFICKTHGEFRAQSREVWGGTGCPDCGKIRPVSNWEGVIKRIRETHGDEYEYFPETYKGVGKKMKVKCKKHNHAWEVVVSDLIIGGGCPKCRYIKSGNKLRLSVEGFIKRSRKTHGDKYDYSKVHQFKTQKEDVTIICPTHGDFKQNPRSHYDGSVCPKCWEDKRSEVLTTPWKEVLKSFRDVHKNKYDYEESDYINSLSKIRIICSKHGEFIQTVNAHKHGQGCPKCGRERISESLITPWKEVLKSFRETHRGKYEYNPKTFSLLETPMEMFCKKHGRFEQTPKNHRKGSGCPICKSSKGEIEIENVLTDLKVQYEHQKKYKELGRKRFDFYIPSINTIIEYNGLQHYEPIEFFGGIKGFERNKKSDKVKRDFCIHNKINYEIIRYDEDVKERLNEILKN